MDDLFGLLYNNISPERKLLTAVTSGLQDTLDTLIRSGQVNLDAKLLEQNGNRALHVACQKGYHGCVRRLINAGANPDIQNDFGFTPLALALRHGHVECLRVLLEHGGHFTDLSLIWIGEQMDGLPTWLGYSHDVLIILLTATPNLAALSDGTIPQTVYEHFLQRRFTSSLMKTFFVTGNTLPQETLNTFMKTLSEFDREWLKRCQTVMSLQHYARLGVRRSLNCNVFFGVKLLPLPLKLMDYLITTNDFD